MHSIYVCNLQKTIVRAEAAPESVSNPRLYDSFATRPLFVSEWRITSRVFFSGENDA